MELLVAGIVTALLIAEFFVEIVFEWFIKKFVPKIRLPTSPFIKILRIGALIGCLIFIGYFYQK